MKTEGSRGESARPGDTGRVVGSLIRLKNKVLYSRRSSLYLALIILGIAIIPRVFYIGRTIHPNGVDEGVQIMAGRMYDFGYDLYKEVNTVQAPLMLTVYGIIEANPVVFRLFSTFSSLVIMAFVMWVGYRIGGRKVMVASGAFMALDLMFLHESRLASLDMFCLLWVSVGVFFVIKFRQSGKKKHLTLSGIALGLSAMIKLFGVIATGAIGLLLLMDLLSETKILKRWRMERFLPPRRMPKVKFLHLVLFSLSFLLVVLVIMTRYGVMNVVEGILFNQMHRPTITLFRRLRYFGIFMLLNLGALPFVIFGLKKLYGRPEGVVLFIGSFYLVWFMFQSATWVHHLIFLSPVISLTAGVGIIEIAKWISRKTKFRMPKTSGRILIYTEVTMILLAAIIGGGFSYVVKERGEPASEKAATVLEDITDEEDFVISGDPLVPAIANRPVPPNVVNVAEVQWPLLTDDELNLTVIEYGVEAVVLTYKLEKMEGFKEFVETHFHLKASITETTSMLDEDCREYKIYYLPENAPIRLHEDWATKKHELVPE